MALAAHTTGAPAPTARAAARHRATRSRDRRGRREHGDGARGGDAARRKHVLVVNAAPVFLDLARELLRDERYDVTTSFVPRAFAQIAAL